jgi:hypothetical protein
VPIEGRTVINVVLEPDTRALDEVVMVAYGTAPKESVTGAITAVNTKSIESVL